MACGARAAIAGSRLSLSVALILAAGAGVAQAQSAPEQLSPKAASAGAASAETDPSADVAPIEPVAFLHHWRATLDYSYRESPLVDVDLSRNGTARGSQVIAGLEAGIGSRGFGRIEAGVEFADSDRSLRFDDMEGSHDRRFIGASGGVFVLPYLAVGLQFQQSGLYRSLALGWCGPVPAFRRIWRIFRGLPGAADCALPIRRQS